jgi:UDP-2-acetamido-2-deoxy-ribo-hexuluronate aminotransferase
MKNLKMVDLYSQYLKIKPEIDTAIEEVLESTAFINGPQVERFTKNLASYLKARHVIGCANGTDALQIALMALGLKPGNEVISPDFTFIATVEVVALLGLEPVIVDVDPETYTMDPAQLENAITPKTKAIIPVHLYGLCANMTEILTIAQKHNIPVIEDTAQALGGNYNDGKYSGKAGTIGTIGCTSFFPSKNLGCFGDGGALITNDDELAKKIRCIANHGAKIKYYHDEVGVNSRLDTLQAAILEVKLRHLDSYASARKKAAEYYTVRLSENKRIMTPTIPDYSDHVFHQYTIRFDGNRDELRNYLASEGIPTMIYYPVPMHGQKAFHIKGSFPVSDALSKSVISLPMHTELKPEEQDYVCDKINAFTKK